MLAPFFSYLLPCLLLALSLLGVSSSSHSSSSYIDESLPPPVKSFSLQHSATPRQPYRQKRFLSRSQELAPLYPGYGTHFIFLYIGTPPARQAAIVDTGSAFTAVPCAGCKDCGKHVDPFFNPSSSSTSKTLKCGSKKKCTFNEHYSEGSSWEAYKVEDVMYVGGNDPTVVKGASDYAIPYTFGCMTSVTGLFQTQLADGIIGLSRNPNALPFQLKKNNVTDSSTFALCLETGNGVDQTMHKKKQRVKYAKLSPNSEYWSVKVSAIHFGADSYSDFKTLNKGGAIFDSGSTDSVLPVALKSLFTKVETSFLSVDFIPNNLIGWQVIPELAHLNKDNQFVSKRDMSDLPSVGIDLLGMGGNATVPKAVQLTLQPHNYLTLLDGAKGLYEISIYFDDKNAIVLGANAMSGHNVIFDSAQNRLGFVPATCRFEEYVIEDDPVLTLPPTAAPKEGEASNEQKRCETSAYSSCSAKCDRPSPRASYRVNGTQYYDCHSDDKMPCFEYCSRSNQVQRGVSEKCLNTFWTECSAQCSQSRAVAYLDKRGKCAHRTETRSCNVDQCPSRDGDILVFSDAMFYFKSDLNEDRPWSKLYEEDIVQALSVLFRVTPGHIDILVDPESSMTQPWAGTKLQIQINLKLADFSGSETKLYKKAEQIDKMFRSMDIGSWVISELSRIGEQLDGSSISRYSYLFSFDFEVRRSVVLPIGSKHDPTESTGQLGGSAANSDVQYKQQMLIYFLVGGILSIALLACIVLFVHYRLRADYALLAKDKVLHGGRMAQRIWNRLRKKREGKDKGMMAAAQGRDMRESESRGLMSGSVHEDDDDDLNEFM